MTRRKCIICEAKGSNNDVFHEIVLENCNGYLHLCNYQFWELYNYFKGWI